MIKCKKCGIKWNNPQFCYEKTCKNCNNDKMYKLGKILDDAQKEIFSNSTPKL